MALALASKLFAAGALLGILLAAAAPSSRDLSTFMLAWQDAPVLALGAALLFALTRWTPSFTWPDLKGRERTVAVFAACASAIIGYAGAYLVTLNFPLSMDEFMVVFDSDIFRGGHLLAPLPTEWQAYAKALQPIFLLDSGGAGVWSSAYLPVNAMLHAAFATLGDRALTAPVLAAIAMLALYGVARQIWPKRPDAAVVAAVLLVTSSQFLVMAMTPYAMTAHLALNLVWLWLFQRNTGASHGGALVVGFAASGLHQVIFHPLFVAPFILTLWTARRFRLAAAYTAGYAAICLFWIFYWGLILPSAEGGGTTELATFFARAWDMLALDAASLGLLIRNLLRFISWQNPMTLALFILTAVSIRRWPRPLPQLLAGIVLTLVTVTLVMPYQGHGWGYRYLHGLLGSISLLAAYGWTIIAKKDAARMRGAFAVCALFALAMLPVRAWQVRHFTQPYAEAHEAIRNTRADIVIVDPADIWFGGDLVRNDPYLRKSPKVMVLNYMGREQLADICRGRRVAVFDKADAASFGIAVGDSAGDFNSGKRRAMSELGCGKVPPGG